MELEIVLLCPAQLVTNNAKRKSFMRVVTGDLLVVHALKASCLLVTINKSNLRAKNLAPNRGQSDHFRTNGVEVALIGGISLAKSLVSCILSFQ